MSEAKKTPWLLILGGCGCLSLVALLVLGGVGFFLFKKTGSFLEDSGFSELLESDESGSTAKEKAAKKGKKSAKSGAKSKAKDPKKAQKDAIEPDRISAYADKALTKKEINDHYKFQEKWKKNAAYKKWVKEATAAQKMEEDRKSGKQKDSVASKLKTVNAGVKLIKSGEGLVKAYDQFIRDEGGYEKYYGRLVRIGGVVAASEAIVETHDDKKLKDPNSNAVAKQMIEERPEVAEQYKESLKEAQAGDKGGAMAAMTLFSHPGVSALARMPAGSFKVWSNLSSKERKELRESLQPEDDMSGWFGLFHINPGALIMMASMSEVEEAVKDN